VSDNSLRKLIKETFLATLLLAAMEGGKFRLFAGVR
jgi:hypothetical protein